MEKSPANPSSPRGPLNWLGLGLTREQAKLVPLVAVLLFIGILMLQSGELFGVETGSGPSERPPNATLVAAPSTAEEDELTLLERRKAAELEEKLALVQGAGRVRVMVTLEAGPTIDVVKNTTVEESTTEESATDNSTRQTQSTSTRSDHVFYRDGSAERPVVSRTSRPEIAGVLIVAEGARDVRIKARLLDAAMVALKIPANRIEVVPADGGK